MRKRGHVSQWEGRGGSWKVTVVLVGVQDSHDKPEARRAASFQHSFA